MSVWVEIQISILATNLNARHAPRERVSWNCIFWNTIVYSKCHAPRERVSWNALCIYPVSNNFTSRSTWACELKLNTIAVPAPVVCHAPRERVSWNLQVRRKLFQWYQSRSTWACELKSFLLVRPLISTPSRSTWACELKWQRKSLQRKNLRHAPRERVSWNISVVI